MKLFSSMLFLLFFLFSCSNKKEPIVQTTFIDSIIQQYHSSASMAMNDADLLFWKKRMDSLPAGFVNEQKYAAALIGRFHLQGNISNLKTADSLMQSLNNMSKEKEAGILRTLASLAILQHRFKDANHYVQKAMRAGSEKYASLQLQYDVAFEMGDYNLAKNTLQQLKSTNEYGYFFRLARQFHFAGEHDSSISAMQKALQLAGSNKSLQQTTLSNMGDLDLHAAKPLEAYRFFKQSLQTDPADLHSLSAMGWIALLHDHNDSLAQKIFSFINDKTQSPEQLLKFSYTSEQRLDSVSSKKYARQFVDRASDSMYGNMYNKYLVDLYTGILMEPKKAKAIAQKELAVRSTPQTFSWYAWSLYKNNEPDSAYKVYQRYVSGKSLEGPELYYMGMMMKGMNKNYNAKQYLNAAYKNRFDLSPAKIEVLQKERD
jgi:Tfp pilus assembly protein PilF